MANFRSVERGVHHAVLDPQHPLLDRIDHREIAVDDEIEHRIENIVGAVREFRRQGFKPRPDVGVRACRPMADADEEMRADERSEEHTSELQSLMRSSYAVFRLKNKKIHMNIASQHTN